jgi:hypothetical protein
VIVVVAFELTAAWGTVIGAAAAIAGGVLAAIYTSRRTRSLALELRALERQDEGLRLVAPLVSEIEGRMTMWYGIATGGTDTTVTQASAEATEFRARLTALNNEQLSWRIRDDAVRERIERLREVLLACGAGNTTDSSEVALVVYAAISLNDTIKGAFSRI